MYGVGQIGQAIFHRVIGARRRRHPARQDIAFDAPFGVGFQKVAPFFLRHAGSMGGRQPAGDGQHGLRLHARDAQACADAGQ